MSRDTSEISDQLDAERLLIQTRLNYESFFNTIDELLFVLDDQGNIIHTNTTVNQRLGFSPAELRGKSVLTLHPEDRRTEARKIVGEMLNGSKTFCPIPLITKHGSQIPVETRVTRGFWDGAPAIFGFSKDISRLTLSEEKFSKLFYLNPLACGLSDIDDFTYIEVNDFFYQLFGFSQQEVIGKTAYELGIISPEKVEKIMQHADSKGKLVNIEADLKTKTGEIKNVLLSAENIHIQDKKYRFTVVNDLTDKKKAEKALQESEIRYQLLFDMSPSGIIVLDDQGIILDVNDAVLKNTLYTYDELIGENITKLVVPEDLPMVGKNIQKVLKGKYLEHEVVNRRKDGVLRTFELRETGITLSNGKRGILTVSNDITQNKLMQLELVKLNETLEKRVEERTKQLQKINRELGFQSVQLAQFNYIISHDLQEPLRTLTTVTELLEEECSGKLNDEANDYIKIISKSSKRMNDLIGGLLDYALIGWNCEKTTVNCNDILQQVQHDLGEKIRITSSKIIACGLPEINGYKTEIQKLFYNLIENSIKYHRDSVPPEIKISAYREGHFWKFIVEDNGIGIDEKDTEKVFVLFKRLHNHGDYEGTGIGLTHCRKIVELHQGNIWLESKPWKGTTVYFTIPI